jgi:hypothetical protein
MKRVPSSGWALFGLAVVIYLVYLLDRGVYVGSFVSQDGPRFYKLCKYLHFTGISLSPASDAIGRNSATGSADILFCPPLKKSEWREISN